ncbi:hypothetical protein V498_02316 [Pseudogymnoascus sp. VKM F-4517 (FW-2822)]|nr:hypothetical protein V498_02316 [Pseudogymnoascus sp. VKM F-4517 (FW-2822)]
MHFFSVVAACLLCSSLGAAGPLPRDRSRKLQFRQAAPFKNTTSTTGAVIEVVPVSLTETSLSTTTTSGPSTELSTASAATTLSTSGFANTTLPSAPSTAATGAGDVPTAAGDGPNAGQTAIGTSQTAKQSFSSNLSGAAPSGSIVQGTGNFSRTTVVSANSNTDASAGSEPTTGTQVFPFAESLTTTPNAKSTTAEAEFTFSSDPVTPTTLSTRTTNAPVAITVSGEGAAVTVTPSFFSSATPLPATTDAPTTTIDEAIIKVPTAITGSPTGGKFPLASASAGVAKNLELATYFNNVFPTLTADMPCAPNSIACVEGSIATCEDGRYVLEECITDKFACYALPLKFSEGVSVQCTSVETAEKALGLPNSLSVTIGSVPVVVPTTTAEAVAQSTSVTDPGPTTSAVEAKTTVAAVLSSESDDGEEEEAEELTTVLHTTLVSTITIAVSDFAPSTVVAAAEAATVEAAAPMATTDKSRISVVPVGAAVGGSGNEEEGGKEGVKEGGPVTVTVTRSVTVTEQFTVTRAGVTSTVTALGGE